jgi:hypothetical protein
MAGKKPDVGGSARALARLGAHRGGKARAAVLTPAERREIARKAVVARWRKQKGDAYQPPPDPLAAPRTPAAPVRRRPSGVQGLRSVFRGKLEVGGLELDCHLLGDGTRVFESPLHGPKPGTAGRGGHLARFLSRSPRAEGAPQSPTVSFKVPGSTAPCIGQEATALVGIAEAYLKAREQGILAPEDQALAKRAESVVRECAAEGILARIDDATGYREFRARRTLRRKLLALVAHDLHRWSRAFPEEFWAELSRLEGIRHRRLHHPLRWGRYLIAFLHDAVARKLENQASGPDPHLRLSVDREEWLDAFVRDTLEPYMRRVVVGMRGCTDLDEFLGKFSRVLSSVDA